MRGLKWIYQHTDLDIKHKKKCAVCNKKLQKKAFYIFNDKYGIKAYVGSTCIEKLPNTNYFNKQVEDKIEEMGLSKNIVKYSDKNIVEIVRDSSYYLYSYLLNNDGDGTEVSLTNISD